MKPLVSVSGRKVLGSQSFEASGHGLAPLLKRSGFLTFLLGLTMMLGCGGGGGILPTASTSNNGGGGSNGNGVGSTAVLVNVGDFATVPGDSGPTVGRIVSFELTIESLALRSSKGDVALLSTPRRFELSHLAFKFEPLLLAHILQGTYNAVLIGVSNPEISFIDSNGVLHEDVAASLTSSSETIEIPLSIDSPKAINLIPLAHSISIGNGNAVTVTPHFDVGVVSLPGEAAKGGQVEALVGRITAVADASSTGRPNFTIDTGNTGSFSFAWDWWDFVTEFQGFSSDDLTAGMTVEVNANPSSDPSNPFLATKVKLEHDVASELVVEGLAFSMSPAQFQMLVREVHGPSNVALPAVGKALIVTANASTQFLFESDNVDLSNLDFTPSFDALSISKGQNVRVAAASGSSTAVTADQLKLEEQVLDGTVGTLTSGPVSGQFSFPLNLTADSAFAQLSGHTSVLVTLQPSTEMFTFSLGDGCIACIAGQPVRVRGLLFFSGGQYRLVAARLAEN